jgi:DNA repair exonuclease SbcCD ATPase subunit
MKKKAAEFDAAKRNDAAEVEKEERGVKEEFSKTLAQSLQETANAIKASQDSLERDMSEEKRLLGIQAQAKAKHAVASERRSQAKVLEANHNTTQAKAEATQTALRLEKDVFALVGRQGFLGTIIDEVLVEIAAVANDILGRVANTQHLSIDFETEKQAETTGNVTARIVPVVYVNGRRVSLTSGISGGMTGVLELAIDIAVADVISRRRGVYPNFLILDEALDGLDTVAKESALEMLRTHCQDRLILVVDHDVAFAGLFDSVTEVEMTNGRSRIVV